MTNSLKLLPRGARSPKFEQVKQRARSEYERAIVKAADEAIRDLEKIKSDLMKRSDLNEANRIQAAIDSLKASSGLPQRFTVNAGIGWQKILQVHAGQKLKITSSGTWCADPTRRKDWTFGPEIITRGGLKWGLFGRVGEGSQLEVGRSATIDVVADGWLELKLGGGNQEEGDEGQVRIEIISIE